ncbi:putative nol1 nop2 sun family protein [Diaporthe ampelina]|uniref:Putative nol1 nop2 sun family protein n=1 Tax=Diaporthe ampelina TaxID=1214573 RepID=A0A0G2FZJ4_9PEZI|nr:putative nol1 nop2 sun family protein [Diaporthe ampelina]
MLRSASELGYDPSTLTLVRIFSSIPAAMQTKVTASKMFTDADARFQKILRKATDPDALTLQGMILAKQGPQSHDRLALDSFRRAEKAWEAEAQSSTPSPASGRRSFSIEEGADPDYVGLPEPREPRWEWEVTWALEQARILQKQKRTEEARDLYRVAALELDNPQGFWNLSCLMDGPRDSPERRTYLLKAAISGVQEACRELGVLEKMAAEREGLADKDRASREMMSQEWFRLADGEDLKSIQHEDEE